VAARIGIALVLAVGLSLALFELPTTWPQRIFVVGLCGLVTVPLAFARELRRRPREVGLFVGSALLALSAVKLFEEPLVRLMVSPLYNLDIDHRMSDCGYCWALDGVALREERPIATDDYNVIFLGDSFAYGDMLPNELDAFPFLVERLVPGIRVANFAWPSSSPLLQVRQLRDLGARYSPDLVVVAFDMTDFQDDLVYRSQLEAQGGAEPWTLSVFRIVEVRLGLAIGVPDLSEWLRTRLRWTRAEGPQHRRIESRQHRHFAMSAPLATNQELMEVSWGYLVQLYEESSALGARFAVVALPRYQHYHPEESPEDWARELFPASDEYLFEPFRWFESKAEIAPFPIFSLLPAFQQTDEPQTVWLDDPHYNEAGHQVAADALAPWLVSAGLVPSSSSSVETAPSH